LATDWTVQVEPFSVGLSFGFSLLVGVFFGVYPAQRASLLDPVETLRSEQVGWESGQDRWHRGWKRVMVYQCP